MCDRVHCEWRVGTDISCCSGLQKEKRQGERTLRDRDEDRLVSESSDEQELRELPGVQCFVSRSGRASAGSCTIPCLGQTSCRV